MSFRLGGFKIPIILRTYIRIQCYNKDWLIILLYIIWFMVHNRISLIFHHICNKVILSAIKLHHFFLFINIIYTFWILLWTIRCPPLLYSPRLMTNCEKYNFYSCALLHKIPYPYRKIEQKHHHDFQSMFYYTFSIKCSSKTIHLT